MAKNGKSPKITEAERMAFKLGQQDRILKCINSSKDSRVKDAYNRGASMKTGKPKRKSLFGD